MKKYSILLIVVIIISLVAILISCGRDQPSGAELSASQVEQPVEETFATEVVHDEDQEHDGDHAVPEAANDEGVAEHEVDDEHGQEDHAEGEADHEDGHSPAEHMAGSHSVPPEAAAVENPIPVSEETIAAGAATFAQNCAVCHGENGEGDGPIAESLETKPANLHEAHVQDWSDGALFWIVSHGVADSPMPPWDKVLSEKERWQLVNFLRTFSDGRVPEVHQANEQHPHSGEVEEGHHEDDAKTGK